MCGRYIIRQQQAAERYWLTHGLPKWIESFNVPPTATVPVIRRTECRAVRRSRARRTGKAAPNECVLLRWGLVPFWCRGRPAAIFDVQRPHRAHRAARPRFAGRGRAASDASSRRQASTSGSNAGSAEAAVSPEAGRPRVLRVRRAVGSLCRAGWCHRVLHDHHAAGESDLVAEIHNSRKRMPAILREEGSRDLAARKSSKRRVPCSCPYPDDLMVAWPVGPRVNSTKNDDESLITPLIAV